MNNGEIVELVIRRNHISISELSRKLNVSRRSLYNWFTQKDLSIETIHKIGEVLKYDFSGEFPDIFDKKDNIVDYQSAEKEITVENQLVNENNESVNYWRSKYIHLLEKHNDFLIHNVR